MPPRWPSSTRPASQAPFCGMATFSVSSANADAAARSERQNTDSKYDKTTHISLHAFPEPSYDVGMTLRSAPGSARQRVALDYEIAQEQASALGRLGRALEAALAALAAYDECGPIRPKSWRPRRRLPGPGWPRRPQDPGEPGPGGEPRAVVFHGSARILRAARPPSGHPRLPRPGRGAKSDGHRHRAPNPAPPRALTQGRRGSHPFSANVIGCVNLRRQTAAAPTRPPRMRRERLYSPFLMHCSY